MIKLIYIPSLPVAKMRHRSTKRGHTYDQNADNHEACIQKAQISGHHGIFRGALMVQYDFVFPRPKSHFGSGRNAKVLRSDAPKYCTNKKDLDNMEKFYADSFNCIAYLDDSQICEVSRSQKRWALDGEIPHVQMNITALEPEKEVDDGEADGIQVRRSGVGRSAANW